MIEVQDDVQVICLGSFLLLVLARTLDLVDILHSETESSGVGDPIRGSEAKTEFQVGVRHLRVP